MKRYKVFNGEQEINFTGEEIGFATTQDRRMSKIRWTDITIYRTQGGKYVVEKVGVSDVFHALDSACKRQNWIEQEYDADEGLRPCPDCRPSTTGRVFVEQDRHTTHVSETAEGCVASMHNRDDDKVEYLPNVAERALHEAARADEAIRQAFLVKEID